MRHNFRYPIKLDKSDNLIIHLVTVQLLRQRDGKGVIILLHVAAETKVRRQTLVKVTFSQLFSHIIRTASRGALFEF